MTVECWSKWHLQHALPVGVPMLLVCIVIPSLPALLLYKHRTQLKAGRVQPDVRMRLGFIHRPYE